MELKAKIRETEEMFKIGDVEYPVTEVEIPSRAIIYNTDIIPPVIKLRPMTTKEEKILYGSNASNVIDMVIKKCVVEPRTLNLTHLIVPDKYALLVALRIISVGDNYKIKYRCPVCRNLNNYEVSLNELPVNYLDDDFIEPIDIELENINKVVSVKLLRGRDLDEIEEMAKRVMRKSKGGNVGDPSYTYRLAKYIQTIDGEEVNFAQALKFVESWTAKVSVEFRNKLDAIEIGYDIRLFKECGECGEELDFELPFTSEFFRPTGL